MRSIATGARPRLLFLVTEDWYFCSHRLPLAVAAREAGFEVSVATRVRAHGDRIRAAGLELIPLDWSRRSVNPLREIAPLVQIVAAYRRLRPSIVHHVAVKPVLYGSLAARIARVPGVINALAGLGYVFSSSDWKARALRPAVRTAFHLLLDARNSRLIVQNPDDRDLITRSGMVQAQRIAVIRGSGVDLVLFHPRPQPQGVPLVVLPARMLRDKGVHEFVEAARRLKREGVAARFALVGEADAENPASIPAGRLQEWAAEGTVEYWGWRDDMAEVLAQCSVVCLPSYYGEGLPKSLLEAAASGRAIVTCDVPGCREAVEDGASGLLVPPRDAAALAAALRRLLADAALRASMGARGRQRAQAEFSLTRVNADTIALYRELLPA
jgi:glycosyltransferase involved in cell wall biosynthesis